MNPKEFVTTNIKAIIEAFPNFKVIYEVDSFDNSHLVEFFPAELHKINKELLKVEAKIMYEFGNAYPHESLCIFAGDNILKVIKPIFVFTGKQFKPSNAYSFSYNYTHSDTFDEYQGIIPKTLNWEYSHAKEIKIPESPIKIVHRSSLQDSNINNIEDDNTVFAMAA